MSRLAELGVRLRREQPGQHRAPCPECARAKSRPRDDALAVKIEPDGGATWFCHRCDWAGGLPPAGTERRQVHRSPPAEAKTGIGSVTAFPDVAARLWATRRPIGPGTVAARY